jgi:hypothetical protein
VESGKTVASSATSNWIDEKSAFTLQKCIDKMILKPANLHKGIDRDEANAWIRWMKSTPAPCVVDLSSDLRHVINATVSSSGMLDALCISRTDFLNRLACRLLLLPSGASLPEPLTEPPASIIYGKLLYGGVSRYRLLGDENSNSRPRRRAGERTQVVGNNNNDQMLPTWMMYGGPDRMYEAMDMGGASILELILLPRGQEQTKALSHSKANGECMVLSNMAWSPTKMLGFVNDDKDSRRTQPVNGDGSMLLGSSPMSLSGKGRNEAFASDFRMSVGGLNQQIEAIVRRVLDGRVIRPADADIEESVQDETSAELAIASMEAEELSLLGLTPVKGLLLFGPPGTGMFHIVILSTVTISVGLTLSLPSFFQARHC